MSQIKIKVKASSKSYRPKAGWEDSQRKQVPRSYTTQVIVTSHQHTGGVPSQPLQDDLVDRHNIAIGLKGLGAKLAGREGQVKGIWTQ